jgi:acyl dehydratase
VTVRWDDVAVGDAMPTLVDEALTVTGIVRYQGASGDFNPIHHDPAFAEQAGFPQVFAVGMRQAGILGARAADWLGRGNVRRLRVRFREPAWPGDVLTYTGVITAKREVAGERLVDLELAATRQTGGVHVSGEATFVVPG